MFRFEISGILWLLTALPLLYLWFWFVHRHSIERLKNSSHFESLKRLIPRWSLRKYSLKAILILFAFAFMLVAWANPQWGSRTEKVNVKRSDVVIALDISESMLAEDISPNRMERAKFFLSELIKKLRGERIALVFFAGNAYLQMPLSDDLAAAQSFIKSANPAQAGTQGTVIADAIELAETVFQPDDASQRALIILSDGENHESEAIEAARKAQEKGIYCYTLGIGTPEGAFIPVRQGNQKVMKTDKAGNRVVSRLNMNMLRDIAEAGGGKFYRIDQGMSAITQLDEDIDRLEKKQVEQLSFTDYNSYFQYFLFIAIVLLLIEMILGNKKYDKRLLKKIIGRSAFFFAVTTFAIVPHKAITQTPHELLMNGDQAYKNENFEKAEEYYRKAGESDASLKARYNLGNSTYKQNRFEEASEHYNSALANAKSNEQKSRIYYNLGNAHFENKNYEEAVNAYKNSIRMDAANKQAKYNLALTRELMRMLQQQQQQQQQKNNSEQNQEQSDKQEQQEENKNQQENNQQEEQQQNQSREEQQDSLNRNQQQSEFDSTRLEKQELDSMDAKNLLRIIQQEEQKVKEKLRKFKSTRQKPEKDW